MTTQSSQRDFLGLETRRYEGIALLTKGVPQAQVARRLGVSRQAVSKWWQAYQAGGQQALKHRPAPGRPKKFTDRHRERLVHLLLQRAGQFGFPTDLWTLDRIRHVMTHRLGITLHRSHIHRVLLNAGWSCQRPMRRARERDEKAIQRWVRVTWPAIKKKPRN